MGSVLKSSWQSIQVHNQHLTAIMAKSLKAATREAAAHLRQVNEASPRPDGAGDHAACNASAIESRASRNHANIVLGVPSN